MKEEVTIDSYSVSTKKDMLNIDMIHTFLSTKAYWCLNIPREKVERSIENSLCFGVYKGDEQVGFARVISDYSTIAYLGDLFILEEHRGIGLSKLLMDTVMNYPDLQGLRRWILITGDAHGLYEKFGWTELKSPSKWLEFHNDRIYS